MRVRFTVAIVIFLFTGFLVGCSSDDDNAPPNDASDVVLPGNDENGQALDDVDEDLADYVDGMLDRALESTRKLLDDHGKGTATLTIGDQTWEFNNLFCEEVEEEGTRVIEFQALNDTASLTGVTPGDSIFSHLSVFDAQNLQNPTFEFEGYAEPLGNLSYEVDGKNISASGEFENQVSDSFEQVEGTFKASCA